MLKNNQNLPESPAPHRPRSRRIERKLWHDQKSNPTRHVGCSGCPEFDVCGGLQTDAAIFDCSNALLQQHIGCDRVCRWHPSYVRRVREVGTFDFDNVARSEQINSRKLPGFIPTIYHRSGRRLPLALPVAALPLYKLIDRKAGRAKFSSRESLCNEFCLDPATRLVLTGTAADAPLERFWAIGSGARKAIAQDLKRLGIELVTTPNFSLFSDRPRWDDLHAMKRIAIVHHEMQSQGLVTALHVNGRTDRDFERWTTFIRERDEINHVAFEFTTGTGWQDRREQHLNWLLSLASSVGRQLTLVLRGGGDLVPRLRAEFADVVYLDTSAFMKTVKRQQGVLNADRGTTWIRCLTDRTSVR